MNLGDMNKENLAWAAGFFDGEGCTSIKKKKSQINFRAVVISMSQKDERVLNKWYKIFHFGYYDDVQTKYGPMWRWNTTTFEQAQYVMCLLWPWLGEVKKEQYERVVKEYLNNRKNVKKVNKIPQHGSHRMYYLKCRCRPCVDFHNNYMREYAVRRRYGY